VEDVIGMSGFASEEDRKDVMLVLVGMAILTRQRLAIDI
jgi:hypothetical protein